MENLAVLILQKALENGLGRKNLNASTVHGGYLFFQLKSVMYAVNIETLNVFRNVPNDESHAIELYPNETSMLIQRYLKSQLNTSSVIDKLTKEICVERGIKL